MKRRQQATSRLAAILAVVALFAAVPKTMAEVADSAANGFTVKISTQIQAAPADVYSRVLRIGDWWDSSHTYSQDAHNLTIEERTGGCFCEKLPTGGGVQHMQVVLFIPGRLLRLSGGLGPLQSMGAAGSMTFTFTPANGGTKLDVTYAVGGYAGPGFTAIAPQVDHVLGEQIARLKNYIEKGDAGPKSDSGKPK